MVATTNVSVKRPIIGQTTGTPTGIGGFSKGGPTIRTPRLSALDKANLSAKNLGFKKAAPDPAAALSATNEDILRKQGLDLDTILTPSGKRRKRSGLRGGDAQELATLLGE